MMHLHMLAVAVAVSVLARLLYRRIDSSRSWQMRWHLALTAFVVPPLLLLATTVAILLMGVGGTVYAWDGLLSYGLSLAFVLLALALWLQLSWLTHKTLREIRRSPKSLIEAGGVRSVGRVMDLSAVFSAQVGVWSSELVMSQALLTHLDEPHLEAVLAHEMGHAHYRDTFWFFWLGGLRRLTIWLPFTEALWQELLLLREVRADRWAARRVDSLVLAESLMSVITAPLMTAESVCPGFSCAAPRSRLAQRIDALLLDESAGLLMNSELMLWQKVAIALALSPLLTIPFHQ
ncbi:MAG: M56 family metallopeptidase [Cyanobacteria bacterium P01_F01_bin.3]